MKLIRINNTIVYIYPTFISWSSSATTVLEWVSNLWENIIDVQIRCRTLHMLLPGWLWLESTLSGFIIAVSWWRSLSLIFIIVIIDIFMILYVKEFIKMGNTPFEYSSRLDTCLKSMILLWSLFGFYLWLISKELQIGIWLCAWASLIFYESWF